MRAVSFANSFHVGNGSIPWIRQQPQPVVPMFGGATDSAIATALPQPVSTASGQAAFHIARKQQAKAQYDALPLIVQARFPHGAKALRPEAMEAILHGLAADPDLSQTETLGNFHQLETAMREIPIVTQLPRTQPGAAQYQNQVTVLLKEKGLDKIIAERAVIGSFPVIKNLGVNGNDLSLALDQLKDFAHRTGKYYQDDIVFDSKASADFYTQKFMEGHFKAYERAMVAAALLMGPHTANLLYDKLETRNVEECKKLLHKIDGLTADAELAPLLRQVFRCTAVGSDVAQTGLKELVEIAHVYKLTGQQDALKEALKPYMAHVSSAKPPHLHLDSRLLKKLALKGLGMSAGLSGEVMDRLPDSAYQQWNFRYINRIPEARNALVNSGGRALVEGLDTIIRHTFEESFQEFLHNPSEAHGRVNLETVDAFRRQGLNYDAWLNFSHTVVFDDGRGNGYSLSLWTRDPGEDLFLGTKASTCFSLGGANSRGMVDTLLHTAIQMVEIRNPRNGQISGYARCYWAENRSTGEPMLMVDNVFHQKLFDGMSDRDKKNLMMTVTRFMKKYGRAVAGKDVPVYASAHCLPLDKDAVERLRRSAELGMLGGTTDGRYILSSICEGVASNIDRPFRADIITLMP